MTIWQPNISDHAGPRYMAIADALAADIRARRLVPGSRLPTHRDLAYRLGVTVGTITRAYSEAQRRGLIDGEVGRGTFVRTDPNAGPHITLSAAVDGVPESKEEPIPLHVNFPTDLDAIGEDDALLRQSMADAARTDHLTQLFNYQPHGGLARHREAAALFMKSHGLDVSPDRLIITSGAQHALFVALGSILEPGDTILAENLTWPGLRRLADFLRVRIQGLPIDSEGIMPDAFAVACQTRKVKALYCVANLHNPTTQTTSARRRQEIASVARQFGVRIIEDDVYGFLAEERLPPVVSFAPELGLFLTSVSKSMAPGLRIGYLAVLDEDMAAFGEAMRSTIYMATPLTAEIASRWIANGIGEKLAAVRRLEYARRQAIAARVLVGLPVKTQPASMHLWLQLPDHWPADAFALEARIRGVAVCPSSHFALSRNATNGVRVSLTVPRRQEDLERGLSIVASLYNSRPYRNNDIV